MTGAVVAYCIYVTGSAVVVAQAREIAYNVAI
jgi:hypothetical protein